MKRFALALLAAILVNLAIFYGLGLLNKKQPKNRELPQISRIHYTPLEIMSAPVAPPPAPPVELPPPPEPMPQAAAPPPPVHTRTRVAESAATPTEQMPVETATAAAQVEVPVPLPPLPTTLPGIELPEMASPSSLMTAPPEPLPPIAESAAEPPPLEPPPPDPPQEPDTEIVFTPDGFIAVENITATLPEAPAYISLPERPLAPPPSRPSSGPTRAPQPIEFAEPTYPPSARRQGIEGHVTIRLHIGIDGEVSDIEIMDVQGHDSFRRAVVAAVRRWRFTPALENGVPVTAWGERTIIFDLD
jgi:protein TonB